MMSEEAHLILMPHMPKTPTSIEVLQELLLTAILDHTLEHTAQNMLKLVMRRLQWLKQLPGSVPRLLAGIAENERSVFLAHRVSFFFFYLCLMSN